MSSIGALGRDCTLPGWAVRPGAVLALRPVGEAMLLWQIIHSINGTRCTPCFASESGLADLLGRSRGALRRRLDSLRGVPGLLLEVKMPRAMPSRLPPVFRWATDPFAVGYWYFCITDYRLPRIAQQFGLSRGWLLRATRDVDFHSMAAKELAAQIKPELFKSIPSVLVQDGGGVGKGGEEKAPKRFKHTEGTTRPKRPRSKRKAGARVARNERRGRGAGSGVGQRA